MFMFYLFLRGGEDYSDQISIKCLLLVVLWCFVLDLGARPYIYPITYNLFSIRSSFKPRQSTRSFHSFIIETVRVIWQMEKLSIDLGHP